MSDFIRPTRGRRTESLRRLAAETHLASGNLILPLFAVSGQGREEDIPSMPGIRRRSVDSLQRYVASLRSSAVLLFGVANVEQKDPAAAAAISPEGPVPKAIQAIKSERPDLLIITDVCLCGYTSHGHCGVLNSSLAVDNETTLDILGRMAVLHAQAGADIVAPSAMMDSQVRVIRQALDKAGLCDTGIMSYAAKFASAFYGPFRDAAHSSPAFGDRRSHQLPVANRREAIRDALLDEGQGADWLMVKPALPYLDVLHELRDATRLPLAAYQVSGEYAMIKAAAAAGAFPEQDAAMESLLCIRRAGADAVISYFAEEACQWLED